MCVCVHIRAVVGSLRARAAKEAKRYLEQVQTREEGGGICKEREEREERGCRVSEAGATGERKGRRGGAVQGVMMTPIACACLHAGFFALLLSVIL